MENWDDYRLILAIHQGKTLRNAAAQLGVNHSTVSRRLATLNQRFGTNVAEPTSTGYTLTSVGEKLLLSAQKMALLVAQDARFERAHALHLTGEITLSVPPPILQFLLLDELHQFQLSHPHIKLNIHTSYDLADLDNCEADVVIRASNTPDEHLTGHRLFSIAVQFYGAKDYLAQTPPEQYRWITHPHSGDKPDWIANTPYPNANVGLCLTDLTLRHQAADQGQGLVRGACYIAAHFNNLVPLQGSDPMPFQELWVLSHPDLAHVPRIQALKAFLADALRAKKACITGSTN